MYILQRVIKNVITKKMFYKFCILMSIFVITFFNTIPLSAVSDFFSDSNIQLYDPGACNPNSNIDEVQQGSSQVAEQPVFMLGDSILQGAWYETVKLKEALSKKGITDITVDAQGSRSIYDHKGIEINSSSVNTTPTTGLEAIDKSEIEVKIKDAKTIVVALGTNQDGDGSTNVYKDRMTDLINKIKSKNRSTSLFVINIFSTDLSKMESHNNMLEALSVSLGFTIIDLAKSNIPLDSKNIHPKDVDAYEKYSEVVANNLLKVKQNSSSSSSEVRYLSKGVGNIPAGGRTTKASIYGGLYKNGKFVPTNNLQDPSGENGDSDDSGIGNRDNKLPGTSSFAELSVSPGSGDYSALGKLPNGTKLEITYKGKRVIAEKADVGAGGPQRPEIDLWWEVAEMLEFKNGIDNLKIRPVSNNTPLTEVGGGKTADSIEQNQDVESTDPCICSASIDSTSSSLEGNNNAEKAFRFFVSKGWTKEQAAGIVGNLLVESNVEPMRLEGTPAGIETSASKFSGSSGWGIAQWTPGSKVIDPLKASGKDPNDLQVQLETIDEGLRGEGILKEKVAGDQLKTTDTAREAAEAFQGSVGSSPFVGYERPASRTATIAERKAKAELTLRSYGGRIRAESTPSSSESSTCVCEDNTDKGAADVVLDPGHSGVDKQGMEIDPETGLYIGDSSNDGERKQVWNVVEKIKKQLESKGYGVLMTKEKEDSYVNLKERAVIANKSNAAIVVSIHTTPGDFGSRSSGWVTPQKVGGYRENSSGEKKLFTDNSIADLSKKYADFILEERKKLEGGVEIHDLDFNGRGGLSPGNLSIVQLFSKVPWIYNEVGQNGFSEDKYANGIANGIEKALGSKGATAGLENNCSGGGNLSSTIKSYAWPNYHPAPYEQQKPAYKTAVEKADQNNTYRGGTAYPGNDCGGFVTLTMINSGYEKNYNYRGKGSYTGESSSTPNSQWKWLEDNWKKVSIRTTSDLEPGDVAINSVHTFMYVGEIEGFNSKFASAAWGGDAGGPGRSPMAGQDDAMASKYTWYRKK